MKHFLFSLLLAAPLAASSQSVSLAEDAVGSNLRPGKQAVVKTSENTDVDATLGSKDERDYQDASKSTSTHGHLVLYAGAKHTWLSELSEWLKDSGRQPLGVKQVNGGERWLFRCPASGDSTLTVSAILNPATERIRRLNISGPPREIVQLFLGYWGLAVNPDDLKPGVILYRDYLGDRVQFDWKGMSPVVSVFRRPEGYFLKVFPE
jgi:hypothetical protein